MTLVDHPIQSRQCLRCKATMTGAAGGEQAPEPGDVSVCWSCVAVLLFTDTGYRWPTDAERADIMADPVVQHVVSGILEDKLHRPSAQEPE